MSIYVNGKFLNQPITGVQRFAHEIVAGLIDFFPDIKILVPNGTEANKRFENHVVEVGSNKGTVWEQLDLAKFMNREKGVLLNLCNTAPIGYGNNIVTIHDLGVFQNRDWYSWKFAQWYTYMTSRIVKNAIKVLTVSEFSRSELVSGFGLKQEDVIVLHNGIARPFLHNEVRTKENIILHVGSLIDRKNVKFIIDCFHRSGISGYKLVLCGNYDSNLKLTNALGSSNDVEIVNQVSDSELKEWYAKSAFVISASKYEGFGLPILEGIAHGAKPLLSNIPVYKELYSDVGVFFDADDPSSLSNIFNSLDFENGSLSDVVIADYMGRFAFDSSVKKLANYLKTL